jgi:hypothetical protein
MTLNLGCCLVPMVQIVCFVYFLLLLKLLLLLLLLFFVAVVLLNYICGWQLVFLQNCLVFKSMVL